MLLAVQCYQLYKVLYNTIVRSATRIYTKQNGWTMIRCRSCGMQRAADAIGECVQCLRSRSDVVDTASIHGPDRARFGLPVTPPASEGGVSCTLCANACRIAEGELGYCGVRENRGGIVRPRAESGKAFLHAYLDRLPTNCCAAWFCPGSEEAGYNLAVFFYGCSFDCLFCQNASHKRLDRAPEVAVEDLVTAALDPKVRCVCFFGGSPEPQLPFALALSKRIIEESDNSKHICFEWNGCGKPDLALEAAELSLRSGGTIKFDLKAFSPNVGRALCGVPIDRPFRNFSLLFESYKSRNFLTATTLLVPHYVDRTEVAGIAGFLGGLDPEIPYSLLAFHPDFRLRDLPVTSKAQVEECYEVARQKLRRVNLGNRQLLGF